MRVVVLIKQVPQNAEVFFNPDHTIDRQHCLKEMNPADKCALLHAVKAFHGPDDEITAVSLGPSYAEDVLREAVALGAQAGVLLEDACFAGSDTYATARILAAALKKLNPDLVLCGRRSIDGETGQVGPELSVQLQIGCLTNVMHFACSKGTITAERLMTGYVETVTAKLPAVVTVVENMDVAALPSLAGLRRAAEAKITRWNRGDIELDAEACGLSGSKTRVAGWHAARSGVRVPTFLRGTEAGAAAIKELLEKL